MFGVCFGYQVFGFVFGGCVECVFELMYGKMLMVEYEGVFFFEGLLLFFEVMRYYSLCVVFEILGDDLEFFVWSEDGVFQLMCYCCLLYWGVQFYLELIFIEVGLQFFGNFFWIVCGEEV